MSQRNKLIVAGLVVAGFFLGRASIFGVLWPFGPAYVAAVSRHRLPGMPAFLLASALGCLSTGGMWPGLSQILFSAILWGVFLVKRPELLRRRWLPLVGASLLAGWGIVAAWRNPTVDGLLAVLFQCVLALLLGQLYFSGVGCLLSGRVPVRLEDKAGLGMLGASVLAGLGGIKAGPADFQYMATAVWLWQAAWYGGVGTGAAAGLVAGVLQVLANAAGQAALGGMGLAGLLAGLGREFGRWGTATGLVTGYGLAALLGLGTADPRQAAGVLAGVAVSLIMPGRVFAWLYDEVRGEAARPGDARVSQADRQASERLEGLAQVFKELSRSFQELAVAEPPPPPEQEISMLVNRLAGQVCHGCIRYQACWFDTFFERYRMVVDLFAKVEAGGAGIEPTPEWRGKCVNAEGVVREAAHLFELRSVHNRWRRKLGESRDLMAGHLAGLARVLEELSREVRGEECEVPAGERTPRLGYTTEVAKLARDGRLVCGDSHLIKELPGDRLLLVLSDGMGAGDRAAGESRTTISLLERLLDAGFDRKVAIRTVNSILVLRSPEESFATLDMAVIDLRSGEAEFIKVGAAPSFVRRRDAVEVISTCSLPLGILDEVDLESSHLVIRPGEVLIMVTDGVLEARGLSSSGDSWVKEAIMEAGCTDEPGLARALLDKAGGECCEDRKDDMTVLVVRFWR